MPGGEGATPEAKRRLRREMEARRRAVPPAEAEAASRAVARWLAADPRLATAARIALYASLPGELPSRPLFEALAAPGRPRLLPRVRGDGLEWAEAQAWEELVPGRFGVSEPTGETVAAPGPGDLVLVPGLAFDAAGGRLGRGGGHYDRAFPARAPSPLLVGVGYRFQCVAAVPRGERDRLLDAIVHEAGILWRREA